MFQHSEQGDIGQLGWTQQDADPRIWPQGEIAQKMSKLIRSTIELQISKLRLAIDHREAARVAVDARLEVLMKSPRMTIAPCREWRDGANRLI